MRHIACNIRTVGVQRAEACQTAAAFFHFRRNEFIDALHLARRSCDRLHNKVINSGRIRPGGSDPEPRTQAGGALPIKGVRSGNGARSNFFRINVAMRIINKQSIFIVKMSLC